MVSQCIFRHFFAFKAFINFINIWTHRLDNYTLFFCIIKRFTTFIFIFVKVLISSKFCQENAFFFHDMSIYNYYYEDNK